MEIKTFEEDKPHLNIFKIQQTFPKYGKDRSLFALESFHLKMLDLRNVNDQLLEDSHFDRNA